MGTHPWARLRQGLAVTTAVAAAGVIAGTAAGTAGAQPQPTVSQVQKRLAQLTSQEDQVVQRYDLASQQLASAQQQLATVNRSVSRDRVQFTAMRGQIAQIAAFAYENGTLSSSLGMLTASNPRTVLSQASMLSQLATSRHQQLMVYVSAARQLTSAQQTAQRTEAGVAAMRSQLARQKASLSKVIAQQKALLASLTAQQQATVTVGVGGTTNATYTGPTGTQAQQAVAFAYAQLGKPYVYGATGPGSYDCSGLTQAAWAAAGVSIPRTSYEQWAALPHVPESAMQPGDIMVFDAEGHVGIYVGNNELIDAPQPGQNVEKVSFSGWYAANFDGAVRP